MAAITPLLKNRMRLLGDHPKQSIGPHLSWFV